MTAASFDRVVWRAKAVLCLLLCLQLQLGISGCGTTQTALAPAEQIHIPLSGTDALSQALRGSPFQDATALDIYPARQEFNVVLGSDTRKLAGKYAFQDGQFTITEITSKSEGRSSTITMDNFKHVTQMVSSDGLEWKSPSVTSRVGDVTASGVDAYLQANAVLMDAARQMDAAAGTASGNSSASTSGSDAFLPKPSTSQISPLEGIIYIIGVIWYPIIGFVDLLIEVFTVSTLLQTSLIGRFDGTWNASNASSKLVLTIVDGKIINIVDSSSGQQLTVSNSKPAVVEGNNVTFSADASVLGQSVPVTFQFDVQEMSNGSLAGSLTTIGSSLARVPVILVRAS